MFNIIAMYYRLALIIQNTNYSPKNTFLLAFYPLQFSFITSNAGASESQNKLKLHS